MITKFPGFLKIALVPTKHIFEIKNVGSNVKYEGIEAEFLKALAKRLNFKYAVLVPKDKTWGSRDAYGNWRGVVGMVNRGEVDIGLSHLDITEARTEAVDFSFPYDVSDKTFVTEHPQPYPSYAAFTYPFNRNLWLYIFIAFVCVCLSLELSSSRKHLSLKFIVGMFGTLCKQPLEVKEKSARWKILFTLWCLFVMVITLSYSDVLLSYLTIPIKEEGVKTVAELSRAVERGSFKCYISNGTYDIHLLLGSNQRELKIIGQKAMLYNWYYNVLNGSLEKYVLPHTAIIANRISLTLPEFHDLYVSDDSFGVWYIGIAVGKNFCCKNTLNKQIVNILSSGLFTKYQRDELSHRKLFLSETREHNTKVHLNHLDIEDVYGMFIPLIIGYVLSFIAFIVEIVYFYFSHKGRILSHNLRHSTDEKCVHKENKKSRKQKSRKQIKKYQGNKL